jgi:molybdopterin converting factor small subunit
LLRPHAGGASSVDARGATVGEVVADLAERYPGMSGLIVVSDGGLHKFVNVYRNDDDIRYLDQLDTKVDDGDVISILPAVAGG